MGTPETRLYTAEDGSVLVRVSVVARERLQERRHKRSP